VAFATAGYRTTICRDYFRVGIRICAAEIQPYYTLCPGTVTRAFTRTTFMDPNCPPSDVRRANMRLHAPPKSFPRNQVRVYVRWPLGTWKRKSRYLERRMNSSNFLKIREFVTADSRDFVTTVRRLAPIRLARIVADIRRAT